MSDHTDNQDDGSRPYVIQPRDTVLSIALMNEVEVDAILQHAKNAELFNELQRDPNMLAPGEILYIPPPEPPTVQVSPEAVNSFTARQPMQHLHLCFNGEAGPLSGEEFEIEGPAELLDKPREDFDKPLEGKLDAQGLLSLKVPALTKRLTITFTKRHVRHEIEVGGLNPAEDRSGLGARLLHLGFLPIDQELDEPYLFETKKAEHDTLETFQKAHLLEPTGYTDERTKKMLIEKHGC